MNPRLLLTTALALGAAFASCTNAGSPDDNGRPADTGDTATSTPESSDDPPTGADLATRLQGVWTRIDYPFSRLEFEGRTVKLTEEGLAEAPAFEPFELADTCPYGDAEAVIPDGATVLVYPEATRCEGIALAGDTLRQLDLQGRYEIVYARGRR